MTEVTAAIIRDKDKILICQRPKGKKMADMWEFPGGKTEVGEHPKSALSVNAVKNWISQFRLIMFSPILQRKICI